MMLDVTQQELAVAAGVSRSHIAGFENGRVNPSIDLVWRISDRLGIDVSFVAHPPVVIGQRSRDVVHACCSGYIDGRLRRSGYLTAREVEIATNSAHGWIDLLAYEPITRTLVIVEIKTRIEDLGAIERQISWYEHNAMAVVRRLGWQPQRVLSWLLLLAADEVERAVRLHRPVLLRSFPARAPEMRRVLEDPRSILARRGLALVDPSSRRRDWLLATRSDGRRSEAPYRDYGDAARRLAS
jgi:transcriptional regulator with XRE-family HTH domain